jgi:hypothetical protein
MCQCPRYCVYPSGLDERCSLRLNPALVWVFISNAFHLEGATPSVTALFLPSVALLYYVR